MLGETSAAKGVALKVSPLAMQAVETIVKKIEEDDMSVATSQEAEGREFDAHTYIQFINTYIYWLIYLRMNSSSILGDH